MANEHLNIKNIPAIIWGDTSSKVYLYIHGQGGYKEEAEAFTVLLLGLVVFLELSELLLPRRITANIIKAIIIAAITAPIRSFLNGITTILV